MSSMSLPRRSPARLATALLLGLALAAGGCTAADENGGASEEEPRLSDTGDPIGPAAEPGQAPLTEEPDGTVIDVGTAPEGMVADAETGLLAVGLREPNRVALVDLDTGEIVEEVPVPGTVRHLQLAAPGGPVLVPAESGDAYLGISLPDGEVTEEFEVEEYPHDVTAAAGKIFVGNEFAGSVSVISDGEIVETIRDGLVQPGGVVGFPGEVAVVDVGTSLVTLYDAGNYERRSRLPAGDGPTHGIAGADGRLYVVDTRGDALLRFAVGDELLLESTIDLPGAPYGVAVDSVRELLWITLTGTNELVGFDTTMPEATEVYRVPTVALPFTVAVDERDGTVVVSGTGSGELQLVDPVIGG
jgi:DNA-binding beta-propeller fold protein YncE